jgi:hypothetical protein
VRQNNPKGGAPAGLALDLHAALVGLDNHFALKESDAKPIFFGGLEGTE